MTVSIWLRAFFDALVFVNILFARDHRSHIHCIVSCCSSNQANETLAEQKCEARIINYPRWAPRELLRRLIPFELTILRIALAAQPLRLSWVRVVPTLVLYNRCDLRRVKTVTGRMRIHTSIWSLCDAIMVTNSVVVSSSCQLIYISAVAWKKVSTYISRSQAFDLSITPVLSAVWRFPSASHANS